MHASRFAEADPYRATTHNKGIMNGIDAVVIATGNDWRAVEAGAHAFAARSGATAALRLAQGRDGDLEGFMEMPLALGMVGGRPRMHRARARLKMSGVELGAGARDAGRVRRPGVEPRRAAGARDRRHPARSHGAARASVAVAAGAIGDEVERVAKEIHGGGQVTLDAAHAALAALRKRDGHAQNAASSWPCG